MTTPTKAARALRAKLQMLAQRGLSHEAASAAAKLLRLELRYDFDTPDPDGNDLFAGVVYLSRGNSRPLPVTFDNSEIASFVKWAIASAFNVEGSIRERNGQIQVCIEAAVESMPTLTLVATTIRDSFTALWKSFAALPGATPQDARCFFLGMYDSMMNDERKSGELLPSRLAPKVKVSRRKRAVTLAPAVAIHPYSAGFALGGKIRMSIPINQIAADLENAEKMARLN